jgi:phage shock protein C
MQVNNRRLYRSTDDRWIGGVAAGVADYFDVDPILVRIIWLISIPFTGFLSVVAYFIMLIVVPDGPSEWPQQSPWQPGGAPIGYSANYTPPAQPAGTPDPMAASAPAPDPSQPGATANPDATQFGTAPAGTDPTGTAPAATPIPPAAQGWGNQDRWQRRQDRWQRRQDRWEQRADRRNSGGLVFGVLLIVVGGLIAWHEINPALDLSLAGPIAAIAFGAFLVVSSVGPRTHS